MGICTVQGRIAIHHKNQANMITQFTTIIGASDVNIAEMANKSKDTVAYTLIDIDGPADAELISMLRSVEGVYRVRVIK
jgi:D-3-phosphoglycerate dehydrogenase